MSCRDIDAARNNNCTAIMVREAIVVSLNSDKNGMTKTRLLHEVESFLRKKYLFLEGCTKSQMLYALVLLVSEDEVIAVKRRPTMDKASIYKVRTIVPIVSLRSNVPKFYLQPMQWTCYALGGDPVITLQL